MDSKQIKATLKSCAGRELLENIAPYWLNKTIDEKNGGFYGGIDIYGEVIPQYHKSSVINARILWTFSSIYMMYPKQEYLDMAHRAYEYLYNYFWDCEHGGMFWHIDYTGNPLNTKKQVYAQAFVIYALCEYYRAVPDKAILDKALVIYKLLEEKVFDAEYNGYSEVFARDWKPLSGEKMLAGDVICDKSMNTHLHVLEAYTNLAHVWDNQIIKERLRNLIDVTVKYIVNPDTYHFNMFFDREWNSKTNRLSYGHDIEGSWLLYEAAEELGNPDIIKKAGDVSVKMVSAVLKASSDTPAVIYETEPGGFADNDYVWWVQAEAVVGYLNAYQLSGSEDFLVRAYDIWQFIDKYVIDKEKGEWFRRLSSDTLKPTANLKKIDEWKGPYHNGRMCLEIIKRCSD